jgi:hypothetical protein
MAGNDPLTTGEIRTIFAEEIAAARGTVSDTFDDGARLFTRSTLPWLREVRPQDRVQGGVALKATGQEVWVHPYIFRLVCKNGAIMARATQTRHIENLDLLTHEEAAGAIREAMRDCCVEEAFKEAAERMRSIADRQIDHTITMLSRFGRGQDLPPAVVRAIMDQFFRERDPSPYGLMNAVTAVARETRDPERRWRLEQLGGGIPVAWVPTPVRDDGAAEALPVQERELQLVA